MVIEKYSFGKMEVSGKNFTSDVIIFPENVFSPWWRKEGHFLQVADISGILDYKPDVVVIGTGYYGRMEVAPEVEERFRKAGIEYHIAESGDAVRIFNSIEAKRKIGAFHLTC